MKRWEKYLKSIIVQILVVVLVIVTVTGFKLKPGEEASEEDNLHLFANIFRNPIISAYSQLNCSELSFEAFQRGLDGFYTLLENHEIRNDSLITIVDFSKPSNQDRFFVIDIKNLRIVFKTLVAHGRNSGDIYATQFSNRPESHQSSLGVYLTDQIYTGKHGSSLLLNGKDKGINDKARDRAIVIHGADYVSEDYIKKYGRLGRSFGCPALSYEVCSKIINTIKGGSCLFIYHPSFFQSTPTLAMKM